MCLIYNYVGTNLSELTFAISIAGASIGSSLVTGLFLVIILIIKRKVCMRHQQALVEVVPHPPIYEEINIEEMHIKCNSAYNL